MHYTQAASIRHDIQAQNFTWLAFRDDFKRPATHLAIRGKALEWYARVYHYLKAPAAKGTLNVFRNFHKAIWYHARKTQLLCPPTASKNNGPASGRP